MGAQGTATLTFGAFPGVSDASVAVTGQAAILSGSLVEAWVFPATTADHSPDEHIVESLRVMAGNVIAGTGFTIYGVNTSQINEPTRQQPRETDRGDRIMAGPSSPNADQGGQGTRIYGAWNVAWCWS